LGGESSVEKSVLMRVVLPNPDSPRIVINFQKKTFSPWATRQLTNNHNRKMSTTFGDNLVPLWMNESLALYKKLIANLVGEVGNANAI
jgi:hypothetical protein